MSKEILLVKSDDHNFIDRIKNLGYLYARQRDITMYHKIEPQLGEMCTEYCKFMQELHDQDSLNTICEHCPLTKMFGG